NGSATGAPPNPAATPVAGRPRRRTAPPPAARPPPPPPGGPPPAPRPAAPPPAPTAAPAPSSPGAADSPGAPASAPPKPAPPTDAGLPSKPAADVSAQLVAALDAIDPAIVGGKPEQAVDRARAQCQSMYQFPKDRAKLVELADQRFTTPDRPQGFGAEKAEKILDALRSTLCPPA
ncbi:hypothetical protein, partial [Streptomyces sp. BE303]|uniref:hypothetical protein n=1 Tax=Streptomyces sp. BE303 TaxID=3002528 RepID=UPI002E799794